MVGDLEMTHDFEAALTCLEKLRETTYKASRGIKAPNATWY